MTASDGDGRGGLREFMDAGGAGRLVAFLVVYLAIYLGAGWVSGRVGGDYAEADLLSSVGSVFFQVTFPLLVGATVLTVLSASTGASTGSASSCSCSWSRCC